MDSAKIRILEAIASCEDPEKLRSYIKNAKTKNEPTIADAALRKLVSILPSAERGSLEHDLWQTIHAFEHLLSEERGKTVRLARTRQKIARVGEKKRLKIGPIKNRKQKGSKCSWSAICQN